MSDGAWFSRSRDVLSSLGGGLFVTVWIVGFAIGIGYISSVFYIPIRLYLVGEIQDATVVRCETIIHHDQYGSSKTYEVEVGNFPNSTFPVADWFECDLQPGDNVALLRSERLDAGVVLPGGQSLLHVVYNYGNGLAVVVLTALIFLFLLLAAIGRIWHFVHVVYGLVLESLRSVRGSAPLAVRAARGSEFLLDLAFVLASICFIGVLLFGIMKGVLYVEGMPEPVVGLAVLSAILVFFSPLWEGIVRWVLRSRERNTVVTIARNVSGSAALILISWRAILFIKNEDWQSYESIRELAGAFLAALIT